MKKQITIYTNKNGERVTEEKLFDDKGRLIKSVITTERIKTKEEEQHDLHEAVGALKEVVDLFGSLGFVVKEKR